MQLDADVLHREVLVPLEPAPLGNLLRWDDDGFVDLQIARLALLATATALVPPLFLPALQLGRLDLRLGFLALQPSDLVAQLLNLLLLMVADLQQTQHQGRDLIGGQLRELRDSWEAV